MSIFLGQKIGGFRYIFFCEHNALIFLLQNLKYKIVIFLFYFAQESKKFQKMDINDVQKS